MDFRYSEALMFSSLRKLRLKVRRLVYPTASQIMSIWFAESFSSALAWSRRWE